MALGIPVVATKVGGNNEIITEGQNGFLVPVGSTLKLSERIIKILENKDIAEYMETNNLRKSNQNFSIDKMVLAYERQYLSLLNYKNQNYYFWLFFKFYLSYLIFRFLIFQFGILIYNLILFRNRYSMLSYHSVVKHHNRNKTLIFPFFPFKSPF